MDSLLIELPKGHYVPLFRLRTTTLSQEDSIDTQSPTQTAPIAGKRFPWGQTLRIAATFLIGLMTAMIYQHWNGSSTRAGDGLHTQRAEFGGQKVAASPLWEKFLQPGISNVLAYGTPQFFSSNGIYFRDIQVNSAEEMNLNGQLRSIQKAMHARLQPSEIYTGVGETNGVYLISRLFGVCRFH